MLEDFFNTEQAAKAIGCSDAHVRRMLAQKLMRGKKVSERTWLIPQREVERVARTQASTGRPRKGKS